MKLLSFVLASGYSANPASEVKGLRKGGMLKWLETRRKYGDLGAAYEGEKKLLRKRKVA